MCAGGTFLKNTGSKSNTLIASSGLAISGAFASSSGNFEGRSTPPSEKPGEASSGLADSHWRRRRRCANCSLKDGMVFPPYLAESVLACGLSITLEIRVDPHLFILIAFQRQIGRRPVQFE